MERKAEYCLTQIFHYLVNGLAAIVFFCCIAYSGYALWDNWSILKGTGSGKGGSDPV